MQMSGRAGRRGKDDRGFCFMMVNDTMDAATCRRAAPSASVLSLSLFSHVRAMHARLYKLKVDVRLQMLSGRLCIRLPVNVCWALPVKCSSV